LCRPRCSPVTPFSSNHPPPPPTHTLSLHDALPIYEAPVLSRSRTREKAVQGSRCGQLRHAGSRHGRVDQIWPLDGGSLRCGDGRSEEHTSELQTPCNLVCRLLLEKKNRQRRTVDNS